MNNNGLPTVSVVIPTLNEETYLQRCLESVAGPNTLETIVADGGSRDLTYAIATACGAVMLESPPGRARQMNAGAARARGDVLLFLHADCRLAPGAVAHLRKRLARVEHHFGYFRQRIEGRHALYRAIELGSNLRAQFLLRPYGDQAMFFRRALFERIGGFPEVQIMEDLQVARSARRFGPFLAMPQHVTCSARRWERDGVIVRILRNWSVALRERLGQPCDQLKRRYEGNDRPTGNGRQRSS